MTQEYRKELYKQNGVTAYELVSPGGLHQLYITTPHGETYLRCYDEAELYPASPAQYLNGHSQAELLAAGKDILAREVLEAGEPDYHGIASLLPPITNGAYCFLGGEASWGGVVVDTSGRIFPQKSGADREPEPLFAPATLIGEAAEVRPGQFLPDGGFPILFSVHRCEDTSYEFMYFVEYGDPDRDPIVWIRLREQRRGGAPEARCFIAAQSRSVKLRPIDDAAFWDAFCSTIALWKEFFAAMPQYSLPLPELADTTRASLAALATTFSADHPHYGHLHYGNELHDNFPPNYIWALEACCLQGHTLRARRIAEHMLAHSLDAGGRFVYRQGDRELYGAAAQEYGQLLFVLERYARMLGLAQWAEPYLPRIIGMGEELLSNAVQLPEYGNRKLILMCAEADTNSRVHIYLSNNLWAVRGLRSLGGLLQSFQCGEKARLFEAAAEELLAAVRKAADEERVDSRFGPLVPFRLGYTAAPLTLSTCEDTFESVDADALRAYLVPSGMRDDGAARQDLTENTYANYRYYPEMLSSMLLRPEEADAIYRMRRELGGELLGMTRFYGWVDDWPVAHYARYLLETRRTREYQLLLYSHTAHHGNPRLACYYEQATIDGGVKAPDCVPSLLTTAMMTSWMFAYEPVNAAELWLLAAVPPAWYSAGFAVERQGCSYGTIDINCRKTEQGCRITGDLSKITGVESIKLFLNGSGAEGEGRIRDCGDSVMGFFDGYVTLKPSAAAFELQLY